MKKLFLAICFVTVAGVFTSNAQTVWGGRVGLCLSTIQVETGYTANGGAGIEAGVVMYKPIKNNWYLNSGLAYSVKRFDVGEELSVSYLEVPAYIGYSFPVAGLSFYAQAGPYMGIKLADSEDMFNSFNAGLGFVGGINVNRFKLEAGYQQGLTNVLGDDYFEATIGSLFLGISYIF